MSDGPRLINPFDPNLPPAKDELAYNATRWAAIAKKELAMQRLDRKVGFIFSFFQRGQIGQGSGLVVSNINNEAVKDELRAMVRRLGDQRRILLPGDLI